MAKISKGMPIEIGIKRLSLLKEKGLITEEIFSDAEELLIKSEMDIPCLLYTSPSPRDKRQSRMPSSA